jgi:hypothetical protein
VLLLHFSTSTTPGLALAALYFSCAVQQHYRAGETRMGMEQEHLPFFTNEIYTFDLCLESAVKKAIKRFDIVSILLPLRHGHDKQVSHNRSKSLLLNAYVHRSPQ